LVFGKLCKEIAVSARLGGPDPEGNSRLRAAIEAARKQSVPRDTIERAIKKGAGIGDDQTVYETVVFEGFTPHKVPVIVECLTDNRNRTSSDVRVLFRKGQLGAIGSVAWMFDRLGIIEATHEGKLDMEEHAIEAGAQDVEALDKDDVDESSTGACFYTSVEDVDSVNKALTAAGWKVSKAELGYRPKSFVDLEGEARKEVEGFLGDIEDCGDVHRVYAGLK
jgi:YebC/PmpR family DNA-binding regulatory protein